MQLQNIDLAIPLLPDLVLREPFWVASCHFTSKESILKVWQNVRPAALTLKTSKRLSIKEDKKQIHYRLFPKYGHSTYCDGPKHEEFLTYEATSLLLDQARKL